MPSLGVCTCSRSHSIQKVTRVAHGVGFVVAYAPMRGKELWIASTVPSLSTDSGWGTRNKFKRLPLPEGIIVQELSAGREHVFVLTTKGEGTVFRRVAVFLLINIIYTKDCPLGQTATVNAAAHQLLRAIRRRCAW